MSEVKMVVDSNKVHFEYTIPNHMIEQYDLYMQSVLEDGAYIVDDVDDIFIGNYVQGHLNIEFHEDMYPLETNMAFMEDIKDNLTMLSNGVTIFTRLN